MASLKRSAESQEARASKRQNVTEDNSRSMKRNLLQMVKTEIANIEKKVNEHDNDAKKSSFTGNDQNFPGNAGMSVVHPIRVHDGAAIFDMNKLRAPAEPGQGVPAITHLDTPLHFGDMRTVEGFKAPDWWNSDWSIHTHPVENDWPTQAKDVEEWMEQVRIPGLTSLHLIEQDKLNSHVLASYLSFKDSAALLTWIDTQVADIVGYFVELRVTFGLSTPRWQKIFRKLRHLEKETTVLEMIQKIKLSQWRSSKSVVVLCEHVNHRTLFKGMINFKWTAIMCCYMILHFSTTGPDEFEKRFKTAEEQPAYADYSADDWFAAMLALAFFYDRRNGKQQVDPEPGQLDLERPAFSVRKASASEIERVDNGTE